METIDDTTTTEDMDAPLIITSAPPPPPVELIPSVDMAPDDSMDFKSVRSTRSDCDDMYRSATDHWEKDSDDGGSLTGSIYGLPAGNVPAYRAIFLISNAALGAGLLNFPEAFMKAGGIHVALTVQFVLLIFIIGAFLILARCATQFQTATYQDMISLMLGRRFRTFCQTCITVYFFGSAITYIIIIGEQASSLMELMTGHKDKWYTNKKLLSVVFSLIFLLPLCIPRRLKVLSYTSFFGGTGAFFITGVIINNYYSGEYKPNPHDPPVVTDWKSTFCALPVICFGFQCHVSSVVVYSELKNRSATKFFWCAFAAMVVCATTYALCGCFGYLTFGKSTHSDILTNYGTNDTLVNIARVCILLILLSSYSIVTFCARTVIDGVVIQFCKYGAVTAEQTEKNRRISITLAWFTGAILLALIVPNIGVAIALISGVASLFIFIFPGLCLLKSVNLRQEVIRFSDKVVITVSGLYLVLGSFIFGLVTVLAIQQDIKMRHVS